MSTFYSENIYLQDLTKLLYLQLTKNDPPEMYGPPNKYPHICMRFQMQNQMKGQEHTPAIHRSDKERKGEQVTNYVIQKGTLNKNAIGLTLTKMTWPDS